MLLERFGLWEGRNERWHVLAGDAAALALCRTFLHDPALLLSTSCSRLSTTRAPTSCRTSWPEGARSWSLRHDPARLAALATARLALA